MPRSIHTIFVRSTAIAAVSAAAVFFGPASHVRADTPPSPQATSAPGAPFNPDGVSGGVYADGPGSTPNGHVTNPTAVSQYDVACFEASQTHP